MSCQPVKKYVRTADDEIVLFDVTLSHDTFKDLHPVSAGFVTILPPLVRVGPMGSDSLGLKPMPEDEQIIKTFLGL